MVTGWRTKSIWKELRRQGVPIAKKYDAVLVRKVIKTYFEYWGDEMIEKGIRLTLPRDMGQIYIVGKERKPVIYKGKLQKNSMIIDFNESIKRWQKEYGIMDRKELFKIPNKKVVFMDNTHTDGKVYRFKWFRLHTRKLNTRKYKFMRTQEYKKKLVSYLKNTPMKDRITHEIC